MSAGLSTEDLVAVEETAAGLRSPEMTATGLNQHLVMNALNSELLDGHTKRGIWRQLINCFG